MNKTGWRYIVAVVLAGVIFGAMPAKPVLAQVGQCSLIPTPCSCLPPDDPNCQVETGNSCSGDSDCAGSGTCNDEELCQGGGGWAGGSCPSNTPVTSCSPVTEPRSSFKTNFRGTCWSAYPSVWIGDGTCQINCNCCPAGQVRKCGPVTSTVNVKVLNNAFPCNNRSDLYITTIPNPDWIEGGDNRSQCWPDGENKQGEVKYKCAYTVSVCGVRSCGCQSPCTAAAASAPTLSSPANNYQSPTTSVNLTWNATSSWGTSCTGGAHYYVVWVRDNVWILTGDGAQ